MPSANHCSCSSFNFGYACGDSLLHPGRFRAYQALATWIGDQSIRKCYFAALLLSGTFVLLLMLLCPFSLSGQNQPHLSLWQQRRLRCGRKRRCRVSTPSVKVLPFLAKLSPEALACSSSIPVLIQQLLGVGHPHMAPHSRVTLLIDFDS